MPSGATRSSFDKRGREERKLALRTSVDTERVCSPRGVSKTILARSVFSARLIAQDTEGRVWTPPTSTRSNQTGAARGQQTASTSAPASESDDPGLRCQRLLPRFKESTMIVTKNPRSFATSSFAAFIALLGFVAALLCAKWAGAAELSKPKPRPCSVVYINGDAVISCPKGLL